MISLQTLHTGVRISLCLICLCLTGCVKLLPDQGPRPKQIVLDPQTIASPDRDPQRWAIAIAKPTASTLNEDNRLVIHYDRDDIHLVDHISGVTYQDNLPDMVQRHLMRAFLSSKKFTAVGFASDTFMKSHLLESDVQTFAVFVTSEGMYARVSITAKLLDHKSRLVQWQETFTSDAPIQKHTLKDFVDALKEAYQTVLYQISQRI